MPPAPPPAWVLLLLVCMAGVGFARKRVHERLRRVARRKNKGSPLVAVQGLSTAEEV